MTLTVMSTIPEEERGVTVVTTAVLLSEEESLANMAFETHMELELLWDEMGISKTEQLQLKYNLIQSVKAVYRNTLEETMASKGNQQQHLQDLQNDIVTMRETLQEARVGQFGQVPGSAVKETLASMETERTCLRQIQETREKTLRELYAELERLTGKLGEHMETSFNAALQDLDVKRIEQFQEAVRIKHDELEKRSAIADSIANECAEIMIQLNVNVDNAFDRSLFNGAKDLDLSVVTMQNLSMRLEELQELKSAREAELKHLGELINQLWEELQIPVSDQEEFFQNVSGIGSDAVDGCQKELERLNELKTFKLVAEVRGLRERVRSLWEEMGTSPEERNQTACMNVQESEFPAILSIVEDHKLVLKSLEERYEHVKALLKLIHMRESITQERAEYEESLKDPTRLTSRSGDGGRLLREAKLQAKIKKHLPRVTSLLKERIAQWEAENKQVFNFNGARYIDHMDAFDRAYAQKKQQEKVEKDRARHEKLEVLRKQRIADGLSPVRDTSPRMDRKRSASRSPVVTKSPGVVRSPVVARFSAPSISPPPEKHSLSSPTRRSSGSQRRSRVMSPLEKMCGFAGPRKSARSINNMTVLREDNQAWH